MVNRIFGFSTMNGIFYFSPKAHDKRLTVISFKKIGSSIDIIIEFSFEIFSFS